MILLTIVYLLFAGDLTFTYFYLKRFKERHPGKDYAVLERNFILRKSIRIFGLNKGMLIGSGIVLCILIVTLKLLPPSFMMFLIGMYYAINLQHLVNWNSLRLLKDIQTESKGGKT